MLKNVLLKSNINRKNKFKWYIHISKISSRKENYFYVLWSSDDT